MIDAKIHENKEYGFEDHSEGYVNKIPNTDIAPDGCPWDSVQTPESMKHEEKFKKMHKLLDSLAPEYGV